MMKFSAPAGIRTPDHLACNSALYWSIPAHGSGLWRATTLPLHLPL